MHPSTAGDCIRLYHFEPRVGVLGPGARAAVWVQGCPFRCAGCCAPDSQPTAGGREVPTTQLADWILSAVDQHWLEGITVSGGEPFSQAFALSEVLSHVLTARPNLTVMTYSGYQLEQLQAATEEGVQLLLRQSDVLIDGLFRRSEPSTHPWKGSENQRIHFLTNRICAADVKRSQRHTELFVDGQRLFAAGIPR